MKKNIIIFCFLIILTSILVACGNKSDSTIKKDIIYTPQEKEIIDKKESLDTTSKINNIIEEVVEEEPEVTTLSADDYFDLISYLESTELDYLYYPNEEKSCYTAEYGDWQIDIYTTDAEKPTLILNDSRTSSRNIEYIFTTNDTTTILVDKENNISIYKLELEPLDYIIKCLISNRQENNPPGKIPIIEGFHYE